ncbi:hypothetical protein HPP92_022361 [Vanilla planifolia]|uniref:Uncharacterized protein n=1 Tax=Vanilla planifolia TaxID=51239 RepID=A0A835PPJ0_VANPL|nr:hypothetical protein HPP92_022361 [Vanilla planifolia]
MEEKSSRMILLGWWLSSPVEVENGQRRQGGRLRLKRLGKAADRADGGRPARKKEAATGGLERGRWTLGGLGWKQRDD